MQFFVVVAEMCEEDRREKVKGYFIEKVNMLAICKGADISIQLLSLSLFRAAETEIPTLQILSICHVPIACNGSRNQNLSSNVKAGKRDFSQYRI